MTHPLTLNEVYAYVHREESRRGVMNPTPSIEKSALVSSSSRGDRGGFIGRGRGSKSSYLSDDRDRLKCEHCGRSRHTNDQCWDLYRRPPDLISRSPSHGGFGNGRGGDRLDGHQPNAHSVTSTPTKLPIASSISTPPAAHDVSTLSSDEIVALKRFVFQLDRSFAPLTSSFAHFGTVAHGLSASFTVPQSFWIIDSSASHHMTGMSSLFTSYHVCSGKDKVRIVDGSLSSIAGHGDILATSHLCFSFVFYVPKFLLNLLSISHLTKTLNCYVTFFPSYCVFQDMATKRTIGLGHENNGLYILDSSSSVATSAIKGNTSSIPDELSLWHRRLGHLSFPVIRKMFPHISFLSLDIFCEPYQLIKHCKSTYPNSINKKSSVPFSLVHSNVWGPAPTISLSSFKYFVTFVDDCSRATWLYLLKHKSDVTVAFKSFPSMVCTQFNTKIQIMRLNNGGEYLSRDLTSFLDMVGIIHQTTSFLEKIGIS